MKKLFFLLFLFVFFCGQASAVQEFVQEPNYLPKPDGKYDNHVLFVDQEKMDLEIIFRSIVTLHTHFHCSKANENEETEKKLTTEFGGIALAISSKRILALSHVVSECDCAVCEPRHLELESEKTYLVQEQGELILLKNIYKNAENDIAIFSVPDNIELHAFPYPVGNSDELKVGNFLYQMGDRIGSLVVKEGIVSSVKGPPKKAVIHRGYGNPDNAFMISNGVNVRDSGSPVVAIRDGNFELVGLVQGEFTNMKRMGWAIRINTICEILKKEGFDICR
ncbi:MAG: hypothetical protein AAB474_02335 [Patescibacteria group bacterium]